MTTYMVRVKEIEIYYIPVEANSEKEAFSNAGDQFEALNDKSQYFDDSDFEVDETSISEKEEG